MENSSLAKTQWTQQFSIRTLIRLCMTVFIVWVMSVSSPLAQDQQHAPSFQSDSLMVAIPAGKFIMGVPRWETGIWSDQRPHKVALDTFSIDRFEVTNIQFKKFIESTGYRTEAEKEGWGTVLVAPTLETKRVKDASWKRPEGQESVFSTDREQHPVVLISWGDARAYCEWKGKRLPTDAEWEYAARASTTTPFWWGDRGLKLVGNFADETFIKIFPDAKTILAANTADGQWYLPNYDDGYSRTAPVGSFPANHWGLFDMSGNVEEWVADWEDPGYDPKSESQNPQGPRNGEAKVLRGGSWTGSLVHQRSGSREAYGPLSQSLTIGFRCAQDGVAPNTINVPSVPAPDSGVHTEGPISAETSSHSPPAEKIPHEMSYVPSGKFWMGSYEGVGDSDEYPRHRVFLDAFFIDQYEVTVAQYAKFLNATGSTPPEDWNEKTVSTYPRKPAVDVSWDNAQAYCEWAGKRLPTEAEWEKAARGTDERLFPWGKTTPNSGLVNRHVSYTDDLYKEQLDVVGKYENGQSPYGVYDMAGNAMEWVADWYGEQYYRESPDQNPTGPEHGTEKVIRGGSSLLKDRFLRTAKRDMSTPSEGFLVGFRCAQDIESPSAPTKQQSATSSQSPSEKQPAIKIPTSELSNDSDGSMILLPAGEFLMGPTSSDFMSTGIPRPINVAVDSFYLDQHEVTNEEFRHFIESTDYQTLAEKEGAAPALIGPENVFEDTQGANWKAPEGKKDVFSSNRGNHPVVSVSWEGAQAYCAWSGKRLPTEAEWEYAAKAGTSTPYWWGKELGSKKIVNVEDVSLKQSLPPSTNQFDEFMEDSDLEEESYEDGFARTAPVGSFPPNPWKLHDMLGNVAEWVADWEDELSKETNKIHRNPKGPSTGLNKVVRGGSWQNYVQDSAFRYGEDPLNQSPDVGFRCARDASRKLSTKVSAEEPQDEQWQSSYSEKQEVFPPIDISQIPMVLIPQGSFFKSIPMSDNDPTTYDDAEERREFPVNAFYLDQHEVTNEQFSTFVQATNHRTKAELIGYAWVYTDHGWKKRKQASWFRPQGQQSIIKSDKHDHPVVSVSWDDANAFCGWAGKRLPTDTEWEYAARAGSRFEKAYDAYQALTTTDNLGNFLDGSAFQAFPLSAMPEAQKDGAVRTAPIGSFSSNTWELHDMLGNVWEWVSNRNDSLYPPDDYETPDPLLTPRQGTRVVRGASWAEDRANDLWENRLKLKAQFRSDAVGFRCAKDFVKTSQPDVHTIIIPKIKKEVKPKALSNEDLLIPIEAKTPPPEILESPMVLISGGEFLMGATDQELTHYDWSLKSSIPDEEFYESELPEDMVSEEEQEFIPFPEPDGLMEFQETMCEIFPEKCERYDSIRPRHKITLNEFYLDKYEVTNQQFAAFIDATNYHTLAEQTGKAYGFTTQTESWGGDIKGASWQRPEGTVSVFESERAPHPVVSVSWGEAKAYCEWVGKRLPTEAEWEYAARAGTTTQFWWGHDYPESKKLGNFSDQATQWKNLDFLVIDGYLDGHPRTALIGSFAANPWGLHDMTGNVKEWVFDWYDKSYYAQSPEQDPTGPEKGFLKVARGNAWTSQDLSLAERTSIIPTRTSADVGFRCAKDAAPSDSPQGTGESANEVESSSSPKVETPVAQREETEELEEKTSILPEATTNLVPLNMAFIPRGTLGEIPVNEFFLDKFEVSNLNFKEFIEATSYRTTAEQTLGGDVFIGDRFENYLGVNWREPEGLWLFTPNENTSVFDTGRAEHPVILVSWNDAQAYCHWVGKRLPTEAEWEYAARAGITTKFWWGDELPTSQTVGNFADETHRRAFAKRHWPIVEQYTDGFARTAPVGSFTPNAWGLYDMAGNVAEWVSARNNNEGQGQTYVAHGGSWVSIPEALQHAVRETLLPTTAKSSVGFRCAQDFSNGQ